jgi:hypothetical protein
MFIMIGLGLMVYKYNDFKKIKQTDVSVQRAASLKSAKKTGGDILP